MANWLVARCQLHSDAARHCGRRLAIASRSMKHDEVQRTRNNQATHNEYGMRRKRRKVVIYSIINVRDGQSAYKPVQCIRTLTVCLEQTCGHNKIRQTQALKAQVETSDSTLFGHAVGGTR